MRVSFDLEIEAAGTHIALSFLDTFGDTNDEQSKKYIPHIIVQLSTHPSANR